MAPPRARLRALDSAMECSGEDDEEEIVEAVVEMTDVAAAAVAEAMVMIALCWMEL